MVKFRQHTSALIKFAVFALVMACTTAVAQTAEESELPPAQEVRYQKLLGELRCLVCQNQSLAESNAELAGDLRGIVLEMIKADKSDNEIFAFVTERYGSFVRYRPPFNLTTLSLWLAPFLVLAISLWVCFNYVRKRTKSE